MLLIAFLLNIFTTSASRCAPPKNILCDVGSWSPISLSGGTWTLFNHTSSDGYPNCSVVLTHDGSIIPRMWFGSSNGDTYDTTYDFSAFEFSAEVTLDSAGTVGYGEFALFFRLTNWSNSATEWRVGSGYAVFAQTANGGRVWPRVIESSGSTDTATPVSASVSMSVKHKLSIIVDLTNNNLYNISFDDVIMYSNLNLSPYNLLSGSMGFWSYYSNLTIHNMIMKELGPTCNPTSIPTTVPTTAPSFNPSYEPTARPSDNPSTMPTNNPSLIPTATPSHEPSNPPTALPTDKPTIDPSSQPTTQPSDSPSVEPSESPTFRPTPQPTLPTIVPSITPSSEPIAPTSEPVSSGNGAGSSSSGGDDDESIFENEAIVIVLIICSFCAVVLIVAAILMYCYYDRKRTKEQIMQKQAKNIELEQVPSAASSTGNTLQSTNAPMGGTSTNDLMGGMGTLNTHVGGKAGEYGRGDGASVRSESGVGDLDENDDLLTAINAAVLPQQPQVQQNMLATKGGARMSVDDALYDVFADLDGGVAGAAGVAGLASGDRNDDVEAGGEHAEGGGSAGMGVTGYPGGGIGGAGPGAGGAQMDTSAMVIVDDGDNLSQKEVLMLVKGHLLRNGFEKSLVLTFLKEFSTKNVTGRDLKHFKNNPKLLDTFQMQFSKQNQVLSIWLTIHMIINEIEKR